MGASKKSGHTANLGFAIVLAPIRGVVFVRFSDSVAISITARVALVGTGSKAEGLKS